MTVKDASLVNEEKLKASGAQGILRQGVGVQIIYGVQVAKIKNNLEEAIK